jgi:hypothetical protein
VRKTVTGDQGLEFSNSSTLVISKHFSFQKYQLKSRATNGDVRPEENKTSRHSQTNTRDEKLQGSTLSKFDVAPADTLGAETEASGPLSPKVQCTALRTESHTTKRTTNRSYETYVDNAPARTERPILKVREAFISSAGVDRGITGNVCLKSPASNINAFPNGLMFPRKSCNDRSRASSDSDRLHNGCKDVSFILALINNKFNKKTQLRIAS